MILHVTQQGQLTENLDCTRRRLLHTTHRFENSCGNKNERRDSQMSTEVANASPELLKVQAKPLQSASPLIISLKLPSSNSSDPWDPSLKTSDVNIPFDSFVSSENIWPPIADWFLTMSVNVSKIGAMLIYLMLRLIFQSNRKYHCKGTSDHQGERSRLSRHLGCHSQSQKLLYYRWRSPSRYPLTSPSLKTLEGGKRIWPFRKFQCDYKIWVTTLIQFSLIFHISNKKWACRICMFQSLSFFTFLLFL